MKAVIFASRARKRVRRPCESMATPGQKVSSKTKNTLRRAMITLRRANAQVRTTSTTHVSGRRSRGSASARKLNEDLLELGLAHLAIPHQHSLLVQPAEDLGQALVEGVHRVLHELSPGVALQHPGQPGQALRRHGVEAERDHVPDADLALQLVGGALSQDAPVLDEGDLVAELLSLAHVVRGQDDGRPPLATEVGDLSPQADGDVRVEAQGRLVEEEDLGVIEQRLGEGEPLLETGGERVVLGLGVRPQLALLDELVDAAPQAMPPEAVESSVEGQDLGRPETPHEGRVAARHVEPPPDRPRLAHDVMAEDGRRSRVGKEQGGQDGQERGLPRPVGPEQAEDGAAWNLQARAPEGLLAPPAQPSAPEGFRKVFRVDGEHGPLILPRGFDGRPRRALNRLKPSGRTDSWSLRRKIPARGAARSARRSRARPRSSDSSAAARSWRASSSTWAGATAPMSTAAPTPARPSICGRTSS